MNLIWNVSSGSDVSSAQYPSGRSHVWGTDEEDQPEDGTAPLASIFTGYLNEGDRPGADPFSTIRRGINEERTTPGERNGCCSEPTGGWNQRVADFLGRPWFELSDYNNFNGTYCHAFCSHFDLKIYFIGSSYVLHFEDVTFHMPLVETYRDHRGTYFPRCPFSSTYPKDGKLFVLTCSNSNIFSESIPLECWGYDPFSINAPTSTRCLLCLTPTVAMTALYAKCGERSGVDGNNDTKLENLWPTWRKVGPDIIIERTNHERSILNSLLSQSTIIIPETGDGHNNSYDCNDCNDEFQISLTFSLRKVTSHRAQEHCIASLLVAALSGELLLMFADFFAELNLLRLDAGGLGKSREGNASSLGIKYDNGVRVDGRKTETGAILRGNKVMSRGENMTENNHSRNDGSGDYGEDAELDWDNFFPYVEFCDSGSEVDQPSVAAAKERRTSDDLNLSPEWNQRALLKATNKSPELNTGRYDPPGAKPALCYPSELSPPPIDK